MEMMELLKKVKDQEIDIEKAYQMLKDLPYEELGYAKVDHHRKIRNGYCEVIFSEGKELSHIRGIVESMTAKTDGTILLTRADTAVFQVCLEVTRQAEYFEQARIVVINGFPKEKTETTVAVLTAGTADIKVAEEAAIVLEATGNRVDRIYDVGVAGIHRLLAQRERMDAARVLVVVAGMEGALASVVGGLTAKPVIAVPTSVGYGANFGGLSALLTMLNSCASGVGVVNIDNGFGAAMLASMINKL